MQYHLGRSSIPFSLRFVKQRKSSLFRLSQLSSSTNYERKTPIEHILLRPGMYVGSVEWSSTNHWIVDSNSLNGNTTSKMKLTKKDVMVSPALLKLFDEILVNAADNVQRSKTNMTYIKICAKRVPIDSFSATSIIKEKLYISIENDGKNIPIEKHPVEGIYIPELIFGHLLTGSNFDDSSSRFTGGSHGYGAKLANIFSDHFQVTCFDHKQNRLYEQTWSNNMKQCGKALVSVNKFPHSFIRIEFEPDLSKFGLTESISASDFDLYLNDILLLFHRRAIDIAACLSPDIRVIYNEEPIEISSLLDYAKMFTTSQSISSPDIELINDETTGVKEDSSSLSTDNVYSFIELKSGWKVAVALSDQYDYMSFVNSVWTPRGGTHVQAISSQITKYLEKDLKSAGLLASSNLLRDQFMVFVSAKVENPMFDGQVKDALLTKAANFSNMSTLTPKDLKYLLGDSGISQVIMNRIKVLNNQKPILIGNKTSKRILIDVPKLEDAHFAGTARALECTLILTEGDSAKALAVAGISAVGRELFGVMPLRGKLLNVRIASRAQIQDNEELMNLCKAIGLDFGKEYKDFNLEKQGLRYGKVMLMCDQDHDGSHIKGLIINFFHHFWPSLLKQEGFLQEFITPIVKVRERGSAQSKKNTAQSFYSLSAYEDWKASVIKADVAAGLSLNKPTGSRSLDKYVVKYYKGLGTSTAEEGRQYFQDIDLNRKTFVSEGPLTDLIDLAFSKHRVSDRKDWLLSSYSPSLQVDNSRSTVSFDDFISKELIHFSFSDNVRSIPSVIDGLKPSQRKVLYGSFKKGLVEEGKVVQLAGYIAEHTAYHHGEASLHATIINMAQNFVGSNNIPLLEPIGQFGTRAKGGSDYASPRYIFTRLSPLARLIFPAVDDELLSYVDEDGISVEPEVFIPIIPFILVNGASGIGTGWSTRIPPYNPLDIIDRVEARLDGRSVEKPLIPWIRGFKGKVYPANSSGNPQGTEAIITEGVMNRVSKTSLEIVELPYEKWTEDYKRFLSKLVENGKIKGFKEFHSTETVRFQITSSSNDFATAALSAESLRLQSSISLANMHAFNADRGIEKYNSAEDIIAAHFPVRMQAYERRKESILRRQRQTELISRNKSRFVERIVSGKLSVGKQNGGMNQSYASLCEELTRDGFVAMEDINANASSKGFDYLLSMPLYSLTEDRALELHKQAEKASEELLRTSKLSEIDMWRQDLNALRKAISVLEINQSAA